MKTIFFDIRKLEVEEVGFYLQNILKFMERENRKIYEAD